MQTKLLINGSLVTGEGRVESVLDPASGSSIAQVAEASEGQIGAAVAGAEAAFNGWAQVPPKDRASLLLKLADRIESDAGAFAELEARNTGKPLAAALNDEIPTIADV
ncbi:MAG: aldehyde dehydrogenase family protein, partial [Sinobacteraceae bacterium]|nr:aldehyde dehydrogenase family protein [Nevskiaceae bacterium]